MGPNTQPRTDLVTMQPLRDRMEAVADAIWEDVQSTPGSEMYFYNCQVKGIDGWADALSITSDNGRLILIEDQRGDAWAVFCLPGRERLAYRQIREQGKRETLVQELLGLFTNRSPESGWKGSSARQH